MHASPLFVFRLLRKEEILARSFLGFEGFGLFVSEQEILGGADLGLDGDVPFDMGMELAAIGFETAIKRYDDLRAGNEVRIT